MLAELKTDLTWLREQVLVALRRGDERALIYKANLTPPGLLHGTPDAYMPYLLLREHVIDRLFAQNTGYWQADLQGVDHLGRADRAELLVDYLDLSERQPLETQNTDPFKFILYSAKIGELVPQMGVRSLSVQ
jgi:hypothetical protein